METVKCVKCGKACKPEGIATGYTEDKDGNKYCYDCSAVIESQALQELPVGGKIHLYLVEDKQHNRWNLQNWTGKLSIPIYRVKRGRHNIAGVRRDFWFEFRSNAYHGVHIFSTLRESKETDWFDLCLLSLHTGLRFGDCCSVRAEEISDGVLTNANRKLERFERRVTIPLTVDLRTRLEIRKLKHTTGYLFPDFADLYNGRDKRFLAFFPKLLQSLEIQETSEGIVGFHSFRHTFNTRLVENGTDLGVRMKLVGHSNINTNQLYNHALTAAKTAVENLNYPKLL